MSEKVIRSVVLLSGPIGAGKSTVAQEMIKSAINPTVYIEGDKFWFFIVKGDKSIGRNKNFRTIMTSMVAASVPYAVNGYEVILDFSIPPWFLDTAHRIAEIRNVRLKYVVLRPSEKICAQPAASRADGTIPDYSSYHDFYLSFDEAERHLICDDSSKVEAIADKIRKGLTEGLFCVP